MIEFDQVSKVFRQPDGHEVRAVDGLRLVVQPGETLCLIDPSGCGKTTAMRLVNRLIEPSEGRVLLDGEDVKSRDPIALRRSIGYVIQSGGLFPHMPAALLALLVDFLLGRVERALAPRGLD